MIGLFAVALLAVVLLPQLWVRHTIARHGKDRPDLQGTGGELARHLLDRFGMKDVRVEVTDLGDHYDPESRTVRLLRKHHEGRSLAAVAVAAHEVGHAIQHSRGDRMLTLRQRLAKFAMRTDRLAVLFFIAAPILATIARHPAVLLAVGAIGLGLMAVRVVVDAVTLPVEYDASFRKALPILKNGQYIAPEDMPAVRSVLRAAALTNLAGALIALVNIARWRRVLR